jgi:hypothetical protein
LFRTLLQVSCASRTNDVREPRCGYSLINTNQSTSTFQAQIISLYHSVYPRIATGTPIVSGQYVVLVKISVAFVLWTFAMLQVTLNSLSVSAYDTPTSSHVWSFIYRGHPPYIKSYSRLNHQCVGSLKAVTAMETLSPLISVVNRTCST